MNPDHTMEQQRQQWRQAQQRLTRSQLRALRDQWLERGSQLPLQTNARRLMWLQLRCSLLLAQRRF